MLSAFFHPRRLQCAPAAALLAAVFALGCTGDSVHASISAEVEKGVNAIRTENLDAYMDQIADEALSPDPNGAAQARAVIRNSVIADWARTTTRSIKVTVDSISSATDSAIVSTSLYWDRIVVRPLGADTVVSNVKHRELWRRTAKGWRPFKILWTGGTSTRNGREESVNRGG